MTQQLDERGETPKFTTTQEEDVYQPTTLDDVLETVHDFIMGKLTIGRLAANVMGALDEASAVFLNREADDLDATFKGGDAMVSIETETGYSGQEHSIQYIVANGDGKAVCITVKVLDIPQTREQAAEMLLSGILGVR